MMPTFPDIPDHIMPLYQRHYAYDTRPTTGEVVEALGFEIRTYSRVFIIVDGLDECLEGYRQDFAKVLGSLASTVNLMVTSRPLPMIQGLFLHAECLNISANNGDIRKYITTRISREHRLSLVIGTDHAFKESDQGS